jgi:hypothetical protein
MLLADAKMRDADGDGADDALFGGDYDPDSAGAAWLLLGGDSSGTFDIRTDASASVAGTTTYGSVGHSVALCDLDGDGALDVIAGAPGMTLGASYNGGVYVWAGPVSGVFTLADARATLAGVDSGDGFGTQVACLGDVDGDGAEELGVTAPLADGPGANSGAAYIFLDGVSGAVSGSDATAILTGDAASDQLATVGTLGDLTGDGLPELYIGAVYADVPTTDAGTVAVFSPSGR